MKIDEFYKGWLVGDFDPSLVKTKDIEVGVKFYKAGDREDVHYHKIATEWTCVISGKISMNGQIYTSGEMAVVNPGEINEFISLEDSSTLVIKTPSVVGDKYTL